MRVHVLGGFLGAGKTTLARALARELARRGERVVIVTNDQGHALVDTAECRRDAEVREIVGGCFCCRYDELESALLAAAAAGATVAIAEAVGSCTDLVATVLAPLADRHPERFELAPLSVVVDPGRVAEAARGALQPDVAYLFRKQIEEADVVVTSRADLDLPDVRDAVHALCPHAAVVRVSGVTGEGITAWLAAEPVRPAQPLSIDYDRYAAAEALLGWCNAEVVLRGAEPFVPADVMRRACEAMADAPIAHLKLTSLEPSGGRAAVVRAGEAAVCELGDATEPVHEARWLVNARVALPPEVLLERLRSALTQAAAPATVAWTSVEAFAPARPTPRHRYASRCGSGDDASCCAAFYDRDDVRALLGDSWHPGGVDLTLALAGKLGLAAGGRVLDVACGQGTSLRAVLERFDVRGVGLDARARGASDERLELRRGDAHAIDAADDAFDAVLCECALSTFFDQPLALREMHRVLRPGGRLALSDMAVEGEIPETLRDWIHTGTCLARAMTADAYGRALRDAGFVVVERWDASDGLRELLRRIKRNLVGAAFAAASAEQPSAAPFDVRAARATLKEAERAIASGIVRYAALVAERP